MRNQLKFQNLKWKLLTKPQLRLTIIKTILALNNRLLIKGVKSASKSSTLFKLWLANSPNVEYDDIVIEAIDLLCGDIAEDLIISPSPEKEIAGFITYIMIIEQKLEKMKQ